MVFSSLQFIGIFLPIFFTIYYLVPREYKNYIVLLGSLAFYFVGTVHNPMHMIIFLLSIVVDYLAARLITEDFANKKKYLIGAITLHLISFCYFKYTGFVIGEINKFTGSEIVNNIVMPIGISFYTFQGISYVIDVYRGKIRADKSLLRFAVYISMFEQLIAGPIVTYSNVQRELRYREVSFKSVRKGLGIFIVGLGLKVLLANPVSHLFTEAGNIGYESISTPLAWMAIFSFTFQIYFDFFGYSLMAVGLGRMMGFNLPKNFDFPYLSRSMTEFWRRWHMTLGSWFRDYLYIPLGGNRGGKLKHIRNMLIVWLFTGIWHGAGYNFLLWGFVLFLILVLEKYVYGEKLAKKPWLGHLYMFFLIPLSWAIFAIDDMAQMGVFFGKLFPIFGGFSGAFTTDFVKYLGQYWYFFLLGILFSTKIPFNLLKKLEEKSKVVTWIILALILAGSVYCMYRGMNDPFLYFRF
jgi:alginate O-acetyltransferase complex protein AlgI